MKTQPGKPQPGVCDLSAALARLGGDVGLLREIAEFFRDDAPEFLARLKVAVAAGDCAEVQRAAHSLKGLAVNFDAHSAAQVALRLEEMAQRGEMASATGAARDLEREISRLMVALLPQLERTG
jgi:two-component system sensor histidine kinase/response regulator